MKSLALYPRGCLRPSLINGLFLYTFNDTLALFLSRFRDSEGLDPSVASGRSIGERGWVSSKVGRGPWQGRLCHSYQFSHLLFTKRQQQLWPSRLPKWQQPQLSARQLVCSAGPPVARRALGWQGQEYTPSLWRARAYATEAYTSIYKAMVLRWIKQRERRMEEGSEQRDR